jgi:hypothetical protein
MPAVIQRIVNLSNSSFNVAVILFYHEEHGGIAAR